MSAEGALCTACGSTAVECQRIFRESHGRRWCCTACYDLGAKATHVYETEACVVQVHRAAGSPTVSFGPFATVEAARGWCTERDVAGVITVLVDPSADTRAGADCWR